jgi:hypothetical protein
VSALGAGGVVAVSVPGASSFLHAVAVSSNAIGMTKSNRDMFFSLSCLSFFRQNFK